MKSGLITIGIFCFSTAIFADTLVGVLMSKDTKNIVIDGREFEGDSIISLIVAPNINNSFGGYLSIGGTFGRTDDRREKDEKNNKFTNDISYRVFNIGVTYSPISHIAFLGGIGYGQSEGKYYNLQYDRYNKIKLNTSHTKKDREVNYSGGINLSYDKFGIIAMYDSYPEVFSIGISYKYSVVQKYKKSQYRSGKQDNRTSYSNTKPKSVYQKKKNCKDGRSIYSKAWSTFVGGVNVLVGEFPDNKNTVERYKWGEKAGSEQIIPRLLDSGCQE